MLPDAEKFDWKLWTCLMLRFFGNLLTYNSLHQRVFDQYWAHPRVWTLVLLFSLVHLLCTGSTKMWYITHKALVAALLVLVASVALMRQLGLLTGSREWQILLLATCIVCQPIEAGKIHAQCVWSFIKTSEALFWGNVTSVWVWAHLKGSLWHAQRLWKGSEGNLHSCLLCVWWPSWNQLLLCQYSKICSGLTCLSNWVSGFLRCRYEYAL